MVNNPVGQSTATSMQRLAALRGVSSLIEWRDSENSYFASLVLPDGSLSEPTRCGQSIKGVEDWLNRQPGVKP